MSIPKIVHYCWFGGNSKPKKVEKCIESWKNKLADYEIIEWNEDNFDVNYNKYSTEAYKAKKYAFVSDIARLVALKEYGGIYLDTDVEVFKSFDEILDNEAVLGFEEANYVATSFMAFSKEHSLVDEFLEVYSSESFINSDGSNNLNTNVNRLTKMLTDKGLKCNNEYQVLDDGSIIFPKEFFSPFDYVNSVYYITSKTFCVHHFYVTWKPGWSQFKKLVKRSLAYFFGKTLVTRLRKTKDFVTNKN